MADIKDEGQDSQNSNSKPTLSQKAVQSGPSMTTQSASIDSHTVSSDDSIFSSIEPSLAGRLRIGYFSTDKACQTDESDIVELKGTTKLMSDLVQEIIMLKKNLSFTKLALQADYDAKIEARSIELYNRTNSHIAEIQKLHEERVNFIRHSFRTQLADAICKISKEYNIYYTLKGEIQNAKYQKEIDQMAQVQEEQKHNERAQQEMLDLLQLQMANQDTDEGEKEPPESSITPQMERHAAEIRQLTDTISNLEDRIDEFSEALEQRTEEKNQIENEYELLKVQLFNEQMLLHKTQEEILELKLQLETERKTARIKLQKQKNDFDEAIEKRTEELKVKVDKAERKSAKKLQKRATQDGFTMTEEPMPECTLDEDLVEAIARYIQIEKRQGQEILKLQKDLETSNKFWEMKLAILQKTLHALKDEMFIRTSLQRQSAKLQHAAITYASDRPASISAEVAPTKSATPTRKLQLPNVIHPPQSFKGDLGNDYSQDNPTGLV